MIYQSHGLETAPVLYLPRDWLRTLDPALSHVKGDVHTG